MVDATAQSLILAVESAVAGGSLSLQKNGEEVDAIVGQNVARADSLLPQIARILSRNQVELSAISHIAVSVGPGSYTGIKIGIATVMGLAASIKIPVNGVVSTEAMVHMSTSSMPKIAALPIGRETVCIHEFNETRAEIGRPRIISRSALDGILDKANTEIIVHRDLYSPGISELVIDAGDNLAYLIGRFSAGSGSQRSLTPVYARPAI
jgi:tRNA threonylcarbamoyl adenosine modification protein YeaZ